MDGGACLKATIKPSIIHPAINRSGLCVLWCFDSVFPHNVALNYSADEDIKSWWSEVLIKQKQTLSFIASYYRFHQLPLGGLTERRLNLKVTQLLLVPVITADGWNLSTEVSIKTRMQHPIFSLQSRARHTSHYPNLWMQLALKFILQNLQRWQFSGITSSLGNQALLDGKELTL